jgi:redox-sensitive bicupin YhaK (pirin superfamily)
VPGFPGHPHRGFETVTIVRRGLIDHSDSLGAAARFGDGDVQWLTAGKGIVHSEMFPLLDRERPNPLELFQIWLNLPAADKLAPPHFSMLWREQIPRIERVDAEGRRAEITVVAGALDDRAAPSPPPPPPRSWAARPDSDVAIWTIALDPRATLTLPAALGPKTNRALYFFAGSSLRVGDRTVRERAAIVVRSDAEIRLEAGDDRVELLMLQGRPIAEPVAQYGPFVMSTRAEIQRAFADYQETRFGGWPWPSDDPVHPPDEGRFARHADGRIEKHAR